MGISFLYPSFLWALSLISIPVIIHLFQNKRYKKEYFSQVALLEQVKKEYDKKHKIKNILILICRIGLIASIVIAFARPYTGEQRGENYLSFSKYSIYIDNSYSMSAPIGETTALGKAQKEALLKLNTLSIDARVQVLTNEFSGEEQRFFSISEARKRISEIEMSQSIRTLQDVYNRTMDFYKSVGVGSDQVCRINLSDFQKMSGGEVFIDTTAINIPVSVSRYEDLLIDSIELEQPVMAHTGHGVIRAWIRLNTGIKKTGDIKEEEIPIRMFIDNEQVSVVQTKIRKGEISNVSIPFRLNKSGFHFGELRVEDPVMEYNNSINFTIYKPEYLSVLHIFGENYNEGIHKLFASDSAFRYSMERINSLRYSDIDKVNVVIIEDIESLPSALSEKLNIYMRQGGSVIALPTIPSIDNASFKIGETWEKWLKLAIDATYGKYIQKTEILYKINKEHNIWKNAISDLGNEGNRVDIKTKGRYELPLSNARTEKIIDKFITSYKVGKGKLYLFSSPIDKQYTDFTEKYAFVVCLLGMVFESGGEYELHIIEKHKGIELPHGFIPELKDGYVKIRKIDKRDSVVVIPEIRSTGDNQRIYGIDLLPAGNYVIENSRGDIGLAFSLNTDKREWDQNYMELNKLNTLSTEEGIKTLKSGVNSWKSSLFLWKIFLIFALCFVLAEQILLRKK